MGRKKEDYTSTLTEFEESILTNFVSRFVRENEKGASEIYLSAITDSEFSFEEQKFIILTLKNYGITILNDVEEETAVHGTLFTDAKLVSDVGFGNFENLGYYKQDSDYVDDYTLERCLLLYASAEVRDILLGILKTFSRVEELVIRLRFGFQNGREWTRKEIAEQYNITYDQVRGIEERAIKKLRDPSNLKLLRDYMNQDFNLLNEFDQYGFEEGSFYKI